MFVQTARDDYVVQYTKVVYSERKIIGVLGAGHRTILDTASNHRGKKSIIRCFFLGRPSICRQLFLELLFLLFLCLHLSASGQLKNGTKWVYLNDLNKIVELLFSQFHFYYGNFKLLESCWKIGAHVLIVSLSIFIRKITVVAFQHITAEIIFLFHFQISDTVLLFSIINTNLNKMLPTRWYRPTISR